APRLGRRAVEHELPVEMVELVLRDPGGHALEVVPDLLAGLVPSFEPHGRHPLDRDGHALDGEATLVVGLLLVAAHLERRVDEGEDAALLRGEHEHAAEHADLRRSEADAVRLLHQILHPLDEPAEVVVELLYRTSLHPENGIRILPDLREGKLAPRFAL